MFPDHHNYHHNNPLHPFSFRIGRRRYVLTKGVFLRLAVLALIILAVVYRGKFNSFFDQSLKSDLLSKGINDSIISRNFLALPAYGVSKENDKFDFGNANGNGTRISLSQNYSGPIEVKLDDQRSIDILDEQSSGYSASLLKSFDTEKKAETEKFIKYESKDQRKTVYYSYQKDSRNGQKKLKNWIVYKSGTGEEKESYRIENAILSPYQGGAVAVYYSDKYTDEDKKQEGSRTAIPPDLLIDRPYYLDKDGKMQMLDWVIDEQNNKISLEFKVNPNLYPITLDPTIIHNTEGQFDAGTALNRIESIAGPKVQDTNRELPADKSTFGLWHFNETSNGTCAGSKDACDSSGNGNHGTQSGTTIDTTNQKLGAAARIFGANDYVNIGATTFNTNALKDSFTVEAWFKVDTTRDLNFIAMKNGTTNNLTWSLAGTSTGQVVFYLGQSGVGSNYCYSYVRIPTGEWHHAAGVYDATSLKLYLYIDGIFQSSITYTYGNLSSDSSLLLGGGSTGGDWSFYGTVDEVRLSTRALSPEEVKADAQRVPYGIYSSSVMDLSVGITAINKINWTENGVTTGNGETVYSSSNLAAQWNLNEASGTTTNNDAEGSSCGGTPANCDGTLTNFVNTSGRDVGGTAAISGWTANNRRWGAGALMFDGTDDYVNAGTAVGLGFTGPITMEAWVNVRHFPATDGAIGAIVDKGIAAAGIEGYFLRVHNISGVLYLDAGSYDGTDYMTQWYVSGWNVGEWHHVVGLYDGSNWKVYFDGRQVSSAAKAYGALTTTKPVLIGAMDYNGTLGRYFNGTIDSVRIYSRALSADEILSNYNAGNIEFQTRTGANTSPDGGTWETWKPAGTETQILSMNAESGSWPWDNTSTYLPATTANESNIKMEGSGSMKINVGNIGTGPTFYWHLDETGGTGAYLKESISGSNNGTPSGGVTVVDGIYNKARTFASSSSGYVYTGIGVTVVSNYSISVWFKTTVASGHKIVGPEGSQTGTGSSTFNHHLYVGTDGKLYYGVNDGTKWYAISNNTVTDGEWHHAVATRTSGASGINSLYLDGVLQATTTSGANTMNGYWRMGSYKLSSWTNGSDGYFDGSIDEVSIYNSTISADQVAELYRFGRDHRFTRTISSTDLSGKNKIPFYVAADRPGSYLQATFGETSFANYETDANTVGFWHLDEYIKGTTAAYIKDASSSGLNASLGSSTTYPAFVQGILGGGRYFSNNADKIVTPATSILNTDTHTIDFWIRFNQNTDGNFRQILAYRPTGSDRSPAIWDYPTYHCIHWRYDPGNTQGTECAGPGGESTYFENGKWYHIAGTKSGSAFNFYVNGTLIEAGTVATTKTSGTAPVEMGQTSYSAAYMTLDEVRISNSVRSADDIRQAFEVGKRTHPIVIDFAASLNSGNLISGTADTSFTIDARSYGAQNMGDNIYVGDKIIVKENYDGTEYKAQGTVSSVDVSSGAVTVVSWDAGSTAPSGGYTTGAVLFKWQREYWDISNVMSGQRDGVTKLTLRVTDGAEGRTIFLDDFENLTNYLTDPTATGNVSSTVNRYYQYRSIFSVSDTLITPYISSVSTDYDAPYTGPNLYYIRGNSQMRGNIKFH